MSEKIPNIGDRETPRETTPQEKMQTLVNQYESFSKEPYSSMDQEAVNVLRQNVLNLMDDLKQNHPELRN